MSTDYALVLLDFESDKIACEPDSKDRRQGATEKAVFASGCFWGTEYYLQKAAGVLSTTVGYCGGDMQDPTYQQVSGVRIPVHQRQGTVRARRRKLQPWLHC